MNNPNAQEIFGTAMMDIAKGGFGVVWMAGHTWIRRAFVMGLATAAVALNLASAQSPVGSETLGDLGRKECLAFEGTQTFSREAILRPLEMRLEFHGRTDPAAPLADYLDWIEQTVRRGYQRAGFAKVAVSVQADRPAQRIRVGVVEGPRFRCGAVRVTGLDVALTEQLTNRLQEAAALLETTKGAGQPCFSWSWREGEHAPSDPNSLAGFEQSVVAALGELNRQQAEARVGLALDDSRLQADLLIQIQKPGVVGTLDQIEVEGLRVNSREDLLSFLQLRPGMPLSGNVTNDVLQRLYEAGRFSGHRATIEPLAEPGRYKLNLAVFEFTNAPPLTQKLSPEEQAFLKLRQWVLDWRQRPEDWLLEAQMTRNGRHASAEIVLGQEGLALLIRQPSTNQPLPFGLGLIAASAHLGFYSGSQQSKLTGKPTGTQLKSYLTLAGNPTDDTGRFNLTFGAGF